MSGNENKRQASLPADPPLKTPVLVGLAGSALAIAGSFMVWTTTDLQDISSSASGTSGDGVWTLIAAGLAALLLVLGLVRRSALLTMSATLPALATTVIALYNFAAPDRLARRDLAAEPGVSTAAVDALMDAVDVTTGPGLWLVLIGALFTLGAAGYAGLTAR